MPTDRTRLLFPLALALLLPACAPRRPALTTADLDAAAERYAKLVLAMGRHDADYVDAFYGPPEWKAEAARDSMPLPAIRAAADSLIERLALPGPDAADTFVVLRQRYVRRQLEALVARTRMLGGERLRFDEESQGLYDAAAPPYPDSTFAAALATLDSLLPGQGPLAARYEAYRREFRVPPAKLDTVFRAAIAEARRRTLVRLALPDSESFTVEYVRNQPWGGYNWYQGGYRSLIQVNVDLPTYIDRAIDLACHEGYPGHHVYNALLERVLVRERGWREFSVYPLFSPMSLIAEGTAVVAQDVAFPGEERARFEKRVLFPLAGLDTTRYDRYRRVRSAMEALSPAGTEWARRYLDGDMTREQAIDYAMRHELKTRERAEKSVQFAERYRSYVINYSLGKEIVLAWLAANGGDERHPDRRWALYQTLLASPRLPGDLRP